MSSLLPCPGCRRHVRRTETVCPFCSTEVASAFENAPERAMPPGRLSRAALLTFAAASVAATGCGGSTHSGSNSQAVTDAATGGAAGGGSGGASATGGSENAGGTPSSGGAVNSGGTGGEFATPVYGAPFPVDAGAAVDAGSDAGDDAASDATVGSGGSGAAIYGAAPAYGITPAPTG